MRFPFKAVFTGIIAGVAFYFFPFLFQVLLIILLIGLVMRLASGIVWGRSWHVPRQRFFYPYHDDEEIMTIDGGRYIPPPGKAGPESRFRVN